MIDKEFVGIAAGICTAVSLVPQFLKTIKEKRVEGVSSFVFVVLFFGNSLWVWYGVMLNEWPIIVTNAFSVIMDITMFILKMKYRNKS
ncbi:hypothetical protein EOD41_19165 [Mucilaginibacter limnophilus]|uniref:MtN3 and saliva related transmembrane protein n=1 Tax=Mucilaginibacter limnophilus TaxID=1932778 RepID=A0A437MI32_9SPHI|nr:SemiSWEET transporter [Mucilaginibacter limnophilus]RVT97286.1 hypothetical protein EOD41_19165 [Mucilaginibacter limnophilus]